MNLMQLLLGNAIKFSPDHSHVRLSVIADGAGVEHGRGGGQVA